MPKILCIAIVAEETIKHSSGSILGKRKLIECNKRMKLNGSPFVWVCTRGHRRIWPPQEVDRMKSAILVEDPVKKLKVRLI